MKHKPEFRKFYGIEQVLSYFTQEKIDLVDEFGLSLREEFVGRDFGSFKAALKAAREPWLEGLEIFQELKTDANLPRPETLRRKRVFREDEGDIVCPDRLRMGRPFWDGMGLRPRPGGKPILTLGIDLTTAGWQTHESILWKGLAGMLAVDLLESFGYRVEIVTINCVHSLFYPLEQHHVLEIVAKGEKEPLDEGRLVKMVSGWFYRTIIFGLKASERKDGQMPRDGLGHVRSMPTPVRTRYDVLIQGIHDRETALDAVNEVKESFLHV